MNHFFFEEPPVTSLLNYSKELGVKIFSKRDDLFPEAGGGSKARMLQYILADVDKTNTDVVVTAGGPCSNFNRSCALMCSKMGIPMHLVEYTDNKDDYFTSLNYFVCNVLNVRKTRCLKSEVPDVIKRVIGSYKREGLQVKYIYGGGRSLEGVYSYYDASRCLLRHSSTIFDDVFVACGTGTTLTGICAAFSKYSPKTKIHAVSIARSWEEEEQVLTENMKQLSGYLGFDCRFSNMEFIEDYLCGGYGQMCGGLNNMVVDCLSKESLLVDPTYSGKAFWGMITEIRKKPVQYIDHNVLFWNTGGVFNFLSSRKLFE